jgi:hypothetical protein
MIKVSKMIAAIFTQFLNVDNLIGEPPGVGDMPDRLHIAADSESTEIFMNLSKECFFHWGCKSNRVR